MALNCPTCKTLSNAMARLLTVQLATKTLPSRHFALSVISRYKC